MTRAPALLLAALLGSCGRDAPRPGARVAYGPAVKAETSALEPEEIAPQVTLVDAGREPRRALRYHLAAGGRTRLVLRNKAHSKLMPMLDTNVTIHIDVAVSAVEAGTIRLEENMSFGDVGAPEMGQALAAARERILAQMRPRAIAVTIDDRGILRSVPSASVVAPLIVALPSEPVGPGARWHTHLRRAFNFVGTEMDSDVELLAIDGDHLSLRTDIRLKAPAQRMGDGFEIGGVNGLGHGKSEVELGAVLPRADDSTMAIEIVTHGPNGGDVKMDLDAVSETRWE